MYSSLRGCWRPPRMGRAVVMAAGIASIGREAGQSSGLGGSGGAEFRQFSAQAGGGQGAAAWNGANDLATSAQGGIGLDAGLDGIVGLLDRGGKVFQQGIEQAGGCRTGFGGVLAQGVALLDELAPQGEQVAQYPLTLRLGRDALEAGVVGEHGGADTVALGLLA